MLSPLYKCQTSDGGNEHLNTKAKLDMDSEAGDTGLCNDGNDTMWRQSDLALTQGRAASSDDVIYPMVQETWGFWNGGVSVPLLFPFSRWYAQVYLCIHVCAPASLHACVHMCSYMHAYVLSLCLSCGVGLFWYDMSLLWLSPYPQTIWNLEHLMSSLGLFSLRKTLHCFKEINTWSF